MTQYVLSPRKIVIILLSGLAAVNVFAWLVHVFPIWPLQLVLFILLSLVPGAAILRMIGAPFTAWLANLVSSFGLSILALMISGLAANQLLPALGVVRPLELAGILGFLTVLTFLCIVVGANVNRAPVRLRLRSRRLSAETILLATGAALLPVLATFGAFRLNNGGDAVVAGLTLCCAAALITATFARRNHVSEATIAWILFALGLAILLMTALRGWDITGHDIMREFRVYTLTHQAGRWDIGAYRDAYNACLSITILPEVYVKLLHLPGLVVFKLVLQVIFAVCPVVLYLLLRRHFTKLGALVGCMFFMSYSTFINDAAMLTRQGVAYLFFALVVLAAMDKMNQRQTLSHRLLFLLGVMGVILSHYSTTYMFVVMFAVAVICKMVAERCISHKLHMGRALRTVLTPFFAVAITLGAFMWYAQLTGTSGGLVATMKTSIKNIPNLLSDDNKSADTSSALLFASSKSQVDVYESYLNGTNKSNQMATEHYIPSLTEDIIPPTAIGRQLHQWGINASMLTTLRQHTARFLQILAFCSVGYGCYLLLRKKRNALSLDFVCMSVGVISILTLMVVLPTFSLNYGMLRAFHQAMIFLLVPMMFLLAVSSRWLWPRLRTTIATCGMVGLFLLFTGVFAQTIGGVSATLSLNNHGLYYGLYYTAKADLAAFDWMKSHIEEKQAVHAASYAQAIMHDPGYPFFITGILPMQVQEGNYIYLGEAQVKRQKFYVHYEGSSLITTFPLHYYDEQTNKVYSTTSTGVYRQ